MPSATTTGTELIGVEAGGRGIESREHAARFADLDISRPGILHGTRSYVMQDDDGQIMETHSISAGLDYPSVGPEHAHLRQLERAYYTMATDDEALEAFQVLSKLEGIIPGFGKRARRRRSDQARADHAARQCTAGQLVRDEAIKTSIRSSASWANSY